MPLTLIARSAEHADYAAADDSLDAVLDETWDLRDALNGVGETRDDMPGVDFEPLPSPRALAAQCPTPTAAARRTVREARRTIRAILRREDDRLLMIVGPCSVHDTDAALDYARQLCRLQKALGDRLFLVMRVYLEKPRTTIGWRGLVNDPNLDGSFAMAEGLRRSRKLLVEIAEMGLPVATEMLDLNAPAYLADLISFVGIGARTTESQPHRALASGLGMPTGFKNGTDGGLQIALDALVSASRPHSYVGIDADGRAGLLRTAGNPDCVLILRGGKPVGPNYAASFVAWAEAGLRELKTNNPPALVVDASHANSGYQHERQIDVCRDVVRQRVTGTRILRGVMIESNLVGGKQPLRCDGTDRLQHGVSVTDACLGWAETEALLGEIYDMIGAI